MADSLAPEVFQGKGHRVQSVIHRVLLKPNLFKIFKESFVQQNFKVKKKILRVLRGGEGDCFYVVGSGEFEVLATQEDKNGEVSRVLQTAERLSSFGELALMYNKPLQTSTERRLRSLAFRET